MKGKLLSLLVMITSAAGSFSQAPLQWTFHQLDTDKEYELGEKGSVQEALFKNKVLPDPFYGLNESKYLWIEQEDWIFETQFLISEADLHNDFIDLHFENIDTYATVFINDHEVGKTASAFIPYRFSIKKLLKEGTNEIKVHFVSPVNYHKEAYQGLKVKFPAPNDVHDSVRASSMTRKPQFQFGWDWSLRMNTIGLNAPAFIEMYNMNKVVQASVQTLEITENAADLLLNVILAHPPKQEISIQNKFIHPYRTEVDGNVVRFHFKIENPQLYWPVGTGQQQLYEGELKVYEGTTLVGDQPDFYFGISTKKIVQQADQYGTSFEIHWNNERIFCKGGDYVPQDVFLSTVDEQRMASLIDACVAANFNMIRIWGGGYYLPDFFYRYCAKKGILIWQDFMFACALYPADDAFLSLVKNELDYQIPRISAHPNIALFNGNNEVMVAGKYWGFKQQYNIDNQTQEQFDENYKKLFQTLMPAAVKQWTTVPFEHTSPLSHWGKDEWYKHGTQHYWGVWHGSDPIEAFAKKSGRFNAEYGFQSFPEYSTLLKVSEKKDWNLESEVIKQHQKSYVGNAMILKQTEKLFGKPKNFEDFIYLSQLTQAEAVGLAIASHRLQYPRCAGTLYWQINDCWPVSSWSGIDYYGNWKALHYRVKNDFEQLALLRNLEGNSFRYWLFSEYKENIPVEVRYKIYDLKGRKIHTKELLTSLASYEKKEIMLPSRLKKRKAYLINFEWTVGGKQHYRSFIHNEHFFKRDKSVVEVESVEFVEQGIAAVRLRVKNVAAYVWITSENGTIHLRENFLHLLPGIQTVLMEFTGTLPAKEEVIIKKL